LTELVPAGDAHFDWMLGGAPVSPTLRLPPGGVEARSILEMLRGMLANVRAVHGGGGWLIVANGEVVGLCSYKRPADADGMVEIGYGVAASRRRRGHATRAVALMLREAARDPLVKIITAETAVANVASHRALEANGFRKTGTRVDKEDGELIAWRHGQAITTPRTAGTR